MLSRRVYHYRILASEWAEPSRNQSSPFAAAHGRGVTALLEKALSPFLEELVEPTEEEKAALVPVRTLSVGWVSSVDELEREVIREALEHGAAAYLISELISF